ncbi:MAG TPA: DegT/DnrJ/EryC1/StrS family aminotransferase [Candidatus Polarisedimenticolia bacterium]|nr:DegT/DnrJ/EryC1/StrS family aminotransferase [Candidatus Polarisedimenticolia bacterium]
MTIPFMDLKSQHRPLRAELEAAVSRVLESGHFVLGEEVEAFEKEFAAAIGARHAVAVSSGTAALHLALLAAGVGPGDEVITVPFTFVASVSAIWQAGARPVLADVDPATFTLDPSRAEAAISPRTRAILPVHLYGQPADMEPLLEMARRRGIAVVEDAAQAHGASVRGRPAGTMGDLGCFSFYPSKNLGACGEGGLITTQSGELAARARMLRDWGQREKYRHDIKGFNARMDGIQGAILRVKLRRLRAWTEARRALAARYDRLLAGLSVSTPAVREGAGHVYHLYTIRAPRRDGLRQALAARGIGTGLHYPVPVHLQPAWADLGHVSGAFPESERAAREVLSLPLYAEMPEEHVDRVAEAVREWAGPA